VGVGGAEGDKVGAVSGQHDWGEGLAAALGDDGDRPARATPAHPSESQAARPASGPRPPADEQEPPDVVSLAERTHRGLDELTDLVLTNAAEDQVQAALAAEAARTIGLAVHAVLQRLDRIEAELGRVSQADGEDRPVPPAWAPGSIHPLIRPPVESDQHPPRPMPPAPAPPTTTVPPAPAPGP